MTTTAEEQSFSCYGVKDISRGKPVYSLSIRVQRGGIGNHDWLYGLVGFDFVCN